MRWLKPNLRSIYGLLGQAGPMAPPALAIRVEEVRQAMLDALAVGDLSETQPQIVRRIFYAQDIQTLWYARSDVMTALAGELGEAIAQEKIAALTRLFDGLLSEARGRPTRPPG